MSALAGQHDPVGDDMPQAEGGGAYSDPDADFLAIKVLQSVHGSGTVNAHKQGVGASGPARDEYGLEGDLGLLGHHFADGRLQAQKDDHHTSDRQALLNTSTLPARPHPTDTLPLRPSGTAHHTRARHPPQNSTPLLPSSASTYSPTR